MNEAFKREISDMLAEERTAAELEECYFSDDDLVPNKANFNAKGEHINQGKTSRSYNNAIVL